MANVIGQRLKLTQKRRIVVCLASLGCWGENLGEVKWPKCGELDIMEHCGVLQGSHYLDPYIPKPTTIT